jgi:hypothetical protein
MSILNWKELLCPNGQNTRISLWLRDNTDNVAPSPSLFTPAEWDATRFPCRVHLVEDLPNRMQVDLNSILDDHYAVQASGTSVRDPFVADCFWTPISSLLSLRRACMMHNFRINCQTDAKVITQHVSYLVQNVYFALTDNLPDFTSEEIADRSVVVTDHVYKLNDEIKILWVDQSPIVFDALVGQLVDDIGAHKSGIHPLPEIPTPLEGYKAILGKVRVVASVSSLRSELFQPLDFLPLQGCSALSPVGSSV